MADRSPIFLLSEEEILCVMTFLWHKDIFSFSKSSKQLHSLINRDFRCIRLFGGLLHTMLLKRGMTNIALDIGEILSLRNSRRESASSSVDYADSYCANDVIRLSSRLTTWPVDVDMVHILNGQLCSDALKEVHLEQKEGGHTHRSERKPTRCIAFCGRRRGDATIRSFVSDNHFPALDSSHPTLGETDLSGIMPPVSIPFTKVVHDPTVGGGVPFLSRIAYYEVTIHPINGGSGKTGLSSVTPSSPHHHHQQHNEQQQQLLDAYGRELPCISVGLAHPLFRLDDKMLGWDSHSHGFHSDDGLYYHANRASKHTKRVKNGMFGVGDTVGVGIIYPLKAADFDLECECASSDLHGNKLGSCNCNCLTCQYKISRDAPIFNETMLFFTRNGRLISQRCVDRDTYNNNQSLVQGEPRRLGRVNNIPAAAAASTGFASFPWFPCVAVDAHNPVEMNFGNTGKPFVFDVVGFERAVTDLQEQQAQLPQNARFTSLGGESVSHHTGAPPLSRRVESAQRPSSNPIRWKLRFIPPLPKCPDVTFFDIANTKRSRFQPMVYHGGGGDNNDDCVIYVDGGVASLGFGLRTDKNKHSLFSFHEMRAAASILRLPYWRKSEYYYSYDFTSGPTETDAGAGTGAGAGIGSLAAEPQSQTSTLSQTHEHQQHQQWAQLGQWWHWTQPTTTRTATSVLAAAGDTAAGGADAMDWETVSSGDSSHLGTDGHWHGYPGDNPDEWETIASGSVDANEDSDWETVTSDEPAAVFEQDTDVTNGVTVRYADVTGEAAYEGAGGR